ncbi:MAG: cobalamin-binding protein [Candidatus Rokubacteria bacterium]|nr:cobalamin-binding protein [Candidatus Rokubacteria bacterium]
MRRLVLVALASTLGLAGPVQAFTVRDMLGREVTLAGPPRRIVSLVPSATEVIFALGAEDRLVGVTDFCDFPPAARAKPSVGGMVAPSLEAIVALRPDLVIATNAGNREETFRDLGRVGIPTYLVTPSRIAEMLDMVARIGELTGRGAAVAPLRARLEQRITAVQRAVLPLRRPRVLYVLWPEPLIVPGRDALVTELIELAGGASVTAGEADAYPRLSLEAAVARAPEVILLANHGSNTGPIAREKWDGLTSLPAVRAGRVQAVNGDLLHRYGPRVVDGLEQLARAIHPEAFR